LDTPEPVTRSIIDAMVVARENAKAAPASETPEVATEVRRARVERPSEA
jgi:hypothetical protein